MYQISYVQTQEERREVWKLTYEEFLRVGYIQPNDTGELSYFERWDVFNNPYTKVIIIKEDDLLLSTVSFTEDSPCLLPHDEIFYDLIQPYREIGLSLSASWRIVTRYGTPAKVTGIIFNEIWKLYYNSETDICFCPFNPKHVTFYEKIFGMQILSESRGEHVLKNQPPSVLMSWPKESLDIWPKHRHRFGIKE